MNHYPNIALLKAKHILMFSDEFCFGSDCLCGFMDTSSQDIYYLTCILYFPKGHFGRMSKLRTISCNTIASLQALPECYQRAIQSGRECNLSSMSGILIHFIDHSVIW